MRLRLLPLITIIVGFVGFTQPVFADPVTAWFNVTVTSGYVFTPGGRESVNDPFSFVMLATFDDQVQSYDVDSDPGISKGSSYTLFGPVTFAGVPAGPASGGVPRAWTTFSRVNNFDRDYFELRARLFHYIEEYQDPFSGFYHSSRVSLERRLLRVTTPYSPAQATAAELLSFLQSGEFYSQNLVQNEEFFREQPGSYTYRGTFTQLDSAPVPEPASMLLVATGLLGAGVRRWRQKRA